MGESEPAADDEEDQNEEIEDDEEDDDDDEEDDEEEDDEDFDPLEFSEEDAAAIHEREFSIGDEFMETHRQLLQLDSGSSIKIGNMSFNSGFFSGMGAAFALIALLALTVIRKKQQRR